MSTFVTHCYPSPTMLDSLITSRTRLRLLVKFFINAANKGHLRGLADEFQESTNAIRKELNNLTEAGYLEKEAVSNKITYSANRSHPLYMSLQGIVHKYIGLDTILETLLERMGAVKKVYVIGDYAEGRDSGTIEIVVVGERLDTAYLNQLEPKVAAEIGREVRFHAVSTFEGDGLLLYGGGE